MVASIARRESLIKSSIDRRHPASLQAAGPTASPINVVRKHRKVEQEEEEKKVVQMESGAAAALPKIEAEGIVFPAAVNPPGSHKTLFLGGAGTRGLDMGGRFVVFTAIGVYLEDDAIRSLAGKWAGKTVDELAGSVDFYRDIYAGSFERFTRVTMVQPLTGQQYSSKVAENCSAAWKAAGIYTQAEAAAIDRFKEAFSGESFPHGASILLTHSPSGSLTIAFSKDGSIPRAGDVVIENKLLSEGVLASIIGEHGVSPAAKRSLAERLSQLLNNPFLDVEKVGSAVTASA